MLEAFRERVKEPQGGAPELHGKVVFEFIFEIILNFIGVGKWKIMWQISRLVIFKGPGSLHGGVALARLPRAGA